MESKKCIDCGTTLPLEKFVAYINRGKQRYRPYCKACRNVRERDMYRRRSRKNAKLRALRLKCKQCNTDLVTVMNAYYQQAGRCAICGIDIEKPPSKHTHLDHCHDSNNFRGLLCVNCNVGLGHFKDNIATLQKAIKYLE